MKLSNLVFLFSLILFSCSSHDSTSTITITNSKLGSRDSKLIDDSIDSTQKKMENFRISNFKTDNKQSKSRLDFIKYYTPNGDLLEYAYAYISTEADLIQVLSFMITGINEIRYNLYQVTTQHDTFFYSGTADCENKYKNELDMDLFRFKTNNEMGPQFEIHINEGDSSAFIKLENKFNQGVNYLYDDLPMQRIK